MEYLNTLLVSMPLVGSMVPVLYVAAKIDTDTTTSETTEIGFAMFVELVMGSNFSLKPWQLTLLKQLSESIKS